MNQIKIHAFPCEKPDATGLYHITINPDGSILYQKVSQVELKQPKRKTFVEKLAELTAKKKAEKAKSLSPSQSQQSAAPVELKAVR